MGPNGYSWLEPSAPSGRRARTCEWGGASFRLGVAGCVVPGALLPATSCSCSCAATAAVLVPVILSAKMLVLACSLVVLVVGVLAAGAALFGASAPLAWATRVGCSRRCGTTGALRFLPPPY